ncbi:hypothetical protein WJX72_010944 [[Myrmecia] bisecta]|uniref:Uncharacterized protein n=1 Tax=[Myrmecia] bisecta TaxID=41462 RepID=A0AAW1P8P2_9CHLO
MWDRLNGVAGNLKSVGQSVQQSVSQLAADVLEGAEDLSNKADELSKPAWKQTEHVEMLSLQGLMPSVKHPEPGKLMVMLLLWFAHLARQLMGQAQTRAVPGLHDGLTCLPTAANSQATSTVYSRELSLPCWNQASHG